MMKDDLGALRIEFGKIKGQEGFYTWVIGGPEPFPGNTSRNFEGPFTSENKAREEAKQRRV
jgi:hypothetical protein